jgi:hypothetical protein
MIGWLDAQAGASGDMLLGALVDAGVPMTVLQNAVDTLGLGIRLTARTCERGGLGGVLVEVEAPPSHERRGLAEARALLAGVDEPVRAVAEQVFQRLAVAEGAVHRIPPEQVHFHEVGALDTLADVVGVAAGFAHLGLSALHCSRVSLGCGRTRGAHGPLPVPVPAVLALLEGAPVIAGPVAAECTTPTGAALLATLVTTWGDLPPMTISATGCGAGQRDPAEAANLIRLVLGTEQRPATTPLLIETNIDDLDPRLWPHVIDRLLAAGAHDAWVTPIVMKKGRPAHTLSVLCPTGRAQDIRAAVFRETSTIGVRESEVRKHHLDLDEHVVLVDGQPIRIKTATLAGEVLNRNPEWTDVQAAATCLGRPAKQILDTARRLAALDPS